MAQNISQVQNKVNQQTIIDLPEQAKNPENPLINIKHLKQLLRTPISQVKQKISNFFPPKVSQFFKKLYDPTFRRAIIKMISIYNNQLRPGPNDQIEYDYPSVQLMKSVCIDLLPGLQEFIQKSSQSELKQLFRECMLETNRGPQQSSLERARQLKDLTPFEIKPNSLDKFDFMPSFDTLMQEIKRQDDKLWTAITQQSPELIKKAFDQVEQSIHKILWSKREANKQSEENKAVGKQQGQVQEQLTLKRTYSEMQQTSQNPKKQQYNFAAIRAQFIEKMPGMKGQISQMSDQQIESVMERHKQLKLKGKHIDTKKNPIDLTQQTNDNATNKKYVSESGETVTRQKDTVDQEKQDKHAEILKHLVESE